MTQIPVYILSEVAKILLKQSLLLIYIPCLFHIVLYFCSKLLYSFPCLVLLAKNVKVFTRSYCSLKWAFAFRSGDLVQVLHDYRFSFKAQDALWPTGGLHLKWGVCFVCMCYETTIQRYFYRPIGLNFVFSLKHSELLRCLVSGFVVSLCIPSCLATRRLPLG